ncbi:MAG: His-Xaa-Ser system radical SAM maturase HxsB [Alphaproteobacteria bacterium]|nr:His-Xaa-Ser system radical SAM maturase HxsB [Alphaproteobacteria bacterium]
MTVRKGTIQLRHPRLDADAVGPFRFGHLANERVVLTHDTGEWHVLDQPDFERLLAGELDAEHPQHAALLDKGFLRDGMDAETIAARFRRKKRWLGMGPHLHVVITTLRCNQSCKYCHASRTDMDRVDTDMSLETAKHVVDTALQSPSPYIAFEFQGGEPTVNMDVIKFVVEYGREKNRYEKKTLDFSLVTNMTYMTEENAEWLLANDVLLCTSLDGPKHVHDWNRPWTGKSGAAYDSVMKWIEYFNRRYVEMGRDPELWHVDALMTTTRKTLDHWREVIDLYVSLGIRNVHLRPLNPFGFIMKTWRVVGYDMDEFLAFYEEALDHIIELNQQGVQLIEGTAAVFLKKILTPDDPNFVDIRSPIGAGTGQVAYNYDGTVFPSDEGRMVDAMGNGLWALGKVDQLSADDIIRHPTVKTMAVASLLDSLPQCSTCWNAPYCGVRPLHNFMMGGDLFGQRPNTPKCKQHMTIARLLFERLDADTDGSVERIFRRWTMERPRETPPQDAGTN